MRQYRLAVVAATLVVGSSACGAARLAVPDGIGPHPVLPQPESAFIPTVNVAHAVGWPEGATPIAARGLTVTSFATGLDHPRWLHVLPKGDVLVAETAAPPRPEEGKGIKAHFMKYFMKKAGAGGPSANRIALLRDTDGDGRADLRAPFIENLNSPFGMALVGVAIDAAGALLVADDIGNVVWRMGHASVVSNGAARESKP